MTDAVEIATIKEPENFSFERKILDHGYLYYVDHCGSDEGIIEAARMSTDKGFVSWEKDEALLDFLYENWHTTPFEMPDLTIEVQAPIMVFREWHRHRTQSYNELSARYTVLPNLYYLPSIERIQKQSKVNKQGSAEGFDEPTAKMIQSIIREEQESIRDHYEQLIDLGVAREIARINCPVSQYSRMRAKANLLNWMRFMGLRRKPDAQWEIRQYAHSVFELILLIFPRTAALFEEYNMNGALLGNTERDLLKEILKLAPPEEVLALVNKSTLNNRKREAFLRKLKLKE